MDPDVARRSGSSAQLSRLRRLGIGLVATWIGLGAGSAAARSEASLEAQNRRLDALGWEYQRAGQAAGRLEEMLDIARQRQALLAALAEQDPGQVLALAIPVDVRNRLPSAVQAKLERHVELEAEVIALYEDDPAHPGLRHYLKTNGRRRSLHFAEPPPDLLTGARVRVRGVEVPLGNGSISGAVVAYCCGIDGGLALVGGNGAGKKSGAGDAGVPAPAPSTTGERRVLTILVHFADDPLEPYSPTQASEVVFGRTGDFIRENSYQQTWLTGDVAGWFTIPLASADCDLFAIATHAKSAASAAGFDLAAYQHLVYAFPRGACTGLGAGTLGGNPSEAWIIGALDLKVLSHELGHNLGLHHARALDCGATVLGTNCTVFEYGDRIDTMGNVASGHYNAFHKDLLGWFDADAAPGVTEVRSDGVYALGPLETAGSAASALAIPKSIDSATGVQSWYYVEYRRAIGFDAFLAANANVSNGLIVHTGSPSIAGSGHQLDMTPGSGLQNWSDWSDPALTVGSSFHDPDTGMTITPLSVGETVAQVSITFGAGAPAPDPGSISLGFEATATSDRAVYASNQDAKISATVTQDGVPVSGASVTFRITDPTGGTTRLSAATGSDGTATVLERLRRRDPRGRYEVHAEAAAASRSANAWTSFVLE